MKTQSMTWKDAIVHILQNNKAGDEYLPMHYRDITNTIIEQQLRTSFGKTPADTVNACLTTQKELFESLGNGLYRLLDNGQSHTTPVKDKADKAPAACKPAADKLIKVYGMFWMREAINWNKNPKLLGIQSDGAEQIDLSEMRGIYMLYDGREVIYVGQATDRPILKRLIEHTKNRLATRWNRFSWFGIDGVNSKGEVVKTGDSVHTDIHILANALEGILIEGIEPRQNRRQGDNFGFEYYQGMDKDLAKKKLMSDISKFM